MKRRWFGKFIAVASLALPILTANAGVISYTDTWDFGGANFYDTEDSGRDTRTATDYLSFNRFDSSLGTLTGVSLTFESDWRYNSGIYADDGYNGWGREAAYGSGLSSQSLLFRLYDPLAANATNYDSEYSSCSVRGNYSDATCSQYEANSGSFDGALNLTSINLDSWIYPIGNAVNVFLREYRTAQVYSCGSDDNCRQWNYYNDWSGSATLSYTYRAVPEPDALGLFGLGLVGLLFARRRRLA